MKEKNAFPGLVTGLLSGSAPGRSGRGGTAKRGGVLQSGEATVPRSYLSMRRALELAARQAGLRYVLMARDEGGPVGPYTPGQKVEVEKLLHDIADAAGLEVSCGGEMAVFQAKLDDNAAAALDRTKTDVRSSDVTRRRYAADLLGESMRVEALPLLCESLKDADRDVRHTAVLALASLEGSFMRSEWEGRVSLFESPDVKLDVETLLWIVEEAAPAGGREWRAAVSLLARARSGSLTRSIWKHVWNRDSAPAAMAELMWAMGRCGDPSALQSLNRRLREPGARCADDRFVAAAAIGNLGLVEALREHIAADGKAGRPGIVRCAAVYGLGFCRGNDAAFELLRSCLSDSDSRVRELAALSIGRQGSDGAARVLTGAVSDESAPAGLRAAASLALARMGEGNAPDALLAAASSSAVLVRVAAAKALGEAGGERAREKLGELIRDPDRHVAASAACALGSIGPARGSRRGDPWPALAGLLSDRKAGNDARIAAAVGMGLGRNPEAAEPLAGVALDPASDRRLRKYAARSLAMLAGRSGQPALRKLLESDPPAGMTDVPLRHLDLGDPEETLKRLSKWLTGGTADEQILAAERIGELGTDTGAELLCGGFNVFHNHARWTHVWSLICSRHPNTTPKLASLLRQSRRKGVRMNAALALSGERSPAAVDALIGATQDKEPEVRKGAANALGECGDPASAQALIKLMENDPDIGVAHQALRALRQHDFAALPEVREALARARGGERDCGAPAAVSLSQQGANTWVLRKHCRHYDDPAIPALSYESALAYDSARGRVVQWGSHGRRADSPQTGFTWIFDTGTQEWSRPASRTEPPGVCMTRPLIADGARGQIVSVSGSGGGHGWVMAMRRRTGTSIPWVFDAREEEWYAMHPPFFHPGGMTEASGCFDARNDAIIVFGGSEPLVYDPHANRWVRMKPPAPWPDRVSGPGGAYDPVTGRFIVVSGADPVRGCARTWAYDLASDRWTELHPESPPGPMSASPLVYDSANDVMLLFRHEQNRIAVYAYHLRENRWESLPTARPAPCYGQFDAAYDPVYSVAVVSGGWEWGQSSAVAVRETWTYRYKPAKRSGGPIPVLPEAPALEVGPDRKVSLRWRAPADAAVSGYHVYRGTGEHPWNTRFDKLTTRPVPETAFVDDTVAAPGPYYYRVAPVLPDGKEVPASWLARTQPLPVREVSCLRRRSGEVLVEWKPREGGSVTGYNIYRAKAPTSDLWETTFYAERTIGEFQKLNGEPVKETSVLDPASELDSVPGECSWPSLYVYVVRSVNALGEESGPSPATLSIPRAPGPVAVVRLDDGRFAVLAGDGAEQGGSGALLFRMDSYKEDWVFRVGGAPAPESVLLDDDSWPRGDRTAYFVAGVDEAGQLGVPSSEAWARNAP